MYSFFFISMTTEKKLIAFLESFLTNERRNTFQMALSQRTNYITLAFENVFQSQNASAVLRTADCLGIKDVHVIETKNQFQIDLDIVRGASDWINMIRYGSKNTDTLTAINYIKSQGYKIVATSPHKKNNTPQSIPLNHKLAIFFGTERTGLSETIINNADDSILIPMYGMTESYNLSVSAGIILYTIMERLRNSDINWHLNEKDYDELYLNWLKKSIRKSDILVNHFLEKDNE